MIRTFQNVLSGRNRQATTTLAWHGLFWIVFSILFDYTTSWTMMSLKGPASEGNLVVKSFFEERTLSSFLTLLWSQRDWIAFALAGVMALLILRSDSASSWLSKRSSFWYFFVIILTWMPALERMELGPSSNLAAIFDPNTNFTTALAILFVFIIALDFLLVLLKVKEPRELVHL